MSVVEKLVGAGALVMALCSALLPLLGAAIGGGLIAGAGAVGIVTGLAVLPVVVVAVTRIVSPYLDGDKIGEGGVEATVPLIFSADETADAGRDAASAVSDDCDGESSVFTGAVNWVQIDLGDDADDADHRITPRAATPRRNGPPVAIS